MMGGWSVTYVIGDVHGMYESLLPLLDILPLKVNDTLIFLGDYIDRGPDPKRTVELVKSLSSVYKTITLKGNHEDMMMKCLKGIDCVVWRYNGADATIRSYRDFEGIKEDLDFFLSLKLYHEEGNFVFVHGGVRPGVPLEDQNEFDLLWIRDEFIFSENPLPGKIVVFGHTPFKEPLIMEDKIGVDTGCVYGGMLSAIRLEDMKVFSVRC